MISTIITIYLVVSLSVLLIKGIPYILYCGISIICFPVIPFLIARKCRKKGDMFWPVKKRVVF